MTYYPGYYSAQTACPIYPQYYGYPAPVYQQTTRAAITGAFVGAIGGALQGLSNTAGQQQGRALCVAKYVIRDAAICGAASFAGATVAGASGTKGVLSIAIFAAASVGTGYLLRKYVPVVELHCDNAAAAVDE